MTIEQVRWGSRGSPAERVAVSATDPWNLIRVMPAEGNGHFAERENRHRPETGTRWRFVLGEVDVIHRERVVIFANGECHPARDVHRWLEGRWVLCADGGTLHALALGLHPDVVIGDLDSLPEDVRDRLDAEGTQFLQYPRDKDYTDLELALQSAMGRGAKDILLLGLLGGRLDQTLANVLLLARPEWDAARLWFAHGSERAHLLRGGESLTLHGHPGDIVSLIPLTPTVTGVTTQGLRWPLREATLYFGHTRTISNELVGEEAAVKVAEGRIVVTISHG